MKNTITINDGDLIALLELLEESRVAFIRQRDSYGRKGDDQMASYMNVKHDEAARMHKRLHDAFMKR